MSSSPVNLKKENRQAFLFGTINGWAWTVAWFYMVLSTLILLTGVILTTFIILVSNIHRTDVHIDQKRYWNCVTTIFFLIQNFFERLMVILGLYLLIGFLSFFLSLLLLRGIQEQNKKKLVSWLSLHLISSCLGVGIILLTLWFTQYDKAAGQTLEWFWLWILFGIFVGVIINSFGGYVIHNYILYLKEPLNLDLGTVPRQLAEGKGPPARRATLTLQNPMGASSPAHFLNEREYAILIVNDDICKYFNVVL